MTEAKQSLGRRLLLIICTATFQYFLEKFAYVIDHDVVDFSSNFHKHPFGNQVAKFGYQKWCQHGYIVNISPDTAVMKIFILSSGTCIGVKKCDYIMLDIIDRLNKRPGAENERKGRPGILHYLLRSTESHFLEK
ncbi:hypothetical protein TNCV_2996081 [Trichonephila clavipes]|nr:hypothetical protein TNCV_2996081 [Trichonephila clavipes]